MRIERIFNPLKIILDTPEEVASLEWLLTRYARETEEKMFGWINPLYKPSESKQKEHRFFTNLLNACKETSKNTEFSK